MAQPNLLSASCTNILIPALNGQEFAPQQLLVTPNISVFNRAIDTSALSALTNFTCVQETELGSAPCWSSSGFGNQSYSWKLFLLVFHEAVPWE